MTDLISREEVRAVVGPMFYRLVDEIPAIVPQVIVNISGGLNQGASADYKVDVYTLDFDTDTFDDDHNGKIIEGDEAYFGEAAADVDPEWVKSVLDAPMIFFSTGELVCEDCGGFGDCTTCNSTGRLPNPKSCGQCEGTGTTQSASNGEGEECPVCDGTGELSA